MMTILSRASLALVFLLAAAAFAHAQTPPPARRTIPPPPDVAAPPADATTTASGLVWKTLQPGTGTEHPTPTDLVTVNYSGWHTDGTMFDSSILRGHPSTFPLNQLIPGWVEGLQLMVAGEKRRLWIPAQLAYNGRPNRPQGMLVFDVELVSFAPVPVTPPDVAAPPDDAIREDSGLYSKVLHAGTGTTHPGKHSMVTVQYSGWTTDGKMFDSSVVRGEPATFPLDKVIKGWQEGVQLMVVGETRRMWIPEKLAYQGQKGMPSGMLVFDVELLSIDKQ